MIKNLKINQKADTIEISDKELSNAIDGIAQKSKNVSFGCVMEMENLFFTAVEFEKQGDVKKQTFTYKDEKHKEKTIEFYDYYDHLKKHRFKWKDGLICYEIKISSDGKNFIKTFKHPYDKKILADETPMILVYNSTKEEERSLNYSKQIPRHFKQNKERSIVKSDQMLTPNLREVIRSEAYVLEDNYRMKLIYLTKNGLNRLRHPLRNYILLVEKGKNTIDIKHRDLYVRTFVFHYYHKNRDTIF